ncbi:MAG: hypothetical protein EOM20_01985 [Spartobacteria bacterium]|nr:hypothetical protein [Spartobacteria bacterium]
MAKQKERPLPVRLWFSLTSQERWFLFALLAIALIGAMARYFHLKKQETMPYYPPGLDVPTMEKTYEQ